MIIFLKIYLTAFLFIIGIFDTSFAASSEEKPSPDYFNQKIEIKDMKGQEPGLRLNKDYLKGYISDTKNILVSPFHWEKSDWINASLIVGITAGFYAFDQDIKEWAQKNRNDTSNKIAKFVKPSGDVVYTIPSLGLFYLYGHFLEDKKAERTALLSVESVVISGIFTEAIKFAAHRDRPRAGDSSHSSFPSGHSSSAFAIATVIASEYKDYLVVPPLAYSVALLSGISRINNNDHWTSDVFFGSALGYFIGKKIVSMHSERKEGNLVILPLISNRYTALVIAYKF